MRDEVKGYSETGLTGYDFIIYKNGERYATITDSTNFIDREGSCEDQYAVTPVLKVRKVNSVKAFVHLYREAITSI